jgi:AhpD family alkylhydroperoxidase
MTRLQVFDPPMCCATGVCGPNVDQQLPRFAADLQWLADQGVRVERHNLAREPRAFVGSAVVKQALVAEGEGCLPLILVDGQIVSRQRYPSRDELAALAGMEYTAPGSLYTRGVEELVALGAAVAANCVPCFRYHFDQARKAGVAREDIAQAVATARKVKTAAAEEILQLAGKHLADEREAELLPISPCCPGGPDGSEQTC